MVTVIPLVAFPPILDSMAPKLWQNPHLIHGRFTPFEMHKVVGQSIGGCHMQPSQTLIDPQPGFIEVNYIRSLDGSLNL